MSLSAVVSTHHMIFLIILCTLEVFVTFCVSQSGHMTTGWSIIVVDIG